MVALVFKPARWAAAMTSSHWEAEHFCGETLLPHPVHQDLGPAPGDGTQPRAHQAANQLIQAEGVVSGHIKNLRRGEAVDRQAEVPNEAHEFQVIGHGELRVEAALEQDPAAAVVLEFREFGRKLVPTEDVATVGPGRPVKGAEASSPRCRCWCS